MMTPRPFLLFATACVGLPTAASAFEIASRHAGQLPCAGLPRAGRPQRCTSPVLAERSPTAPMAVVEAQLEALQRGDIEPCFDYSSTSFRRSAGPRQRFAKIVSETPEYKPLVNNTKYEVLSITELGDRQWMCRLRVENSVGSMPFSVEYRWDLTQQQDGAVMYDLGQCMTHKKYKYRGVVVGWDAQCKQNDEWCEKNLVDTLEHGRNQPFYHVLADTRDRPGPPQMTYVAQECMVCIDPQLIKHPHFGETTFTGQIDEERGTWVPNQALREQYPLGLDGCWLVDRFYPDKLYESFQA